MRHFIISFILSLVFLNNAALACEPCPEMLDIRQTAEKADIILLAHRPGYTPAEDTKIRQMQGPETIELQVLDVLKGDYKDPKITVQSWSGMCQYGIYLKDETAVVFLSHRETEQTLPLGIKLTRHEYDSVNMGCSVHSLPLVNDHIQTGQDQMTIPDFKSRYTE